MPPKQVETIRDVVYYQYAKIIAKSAFGLHSKKNAFGFVYQTFLDLKQGTIKWSEITREDKQLVQTVRACIYCGLREDLEWDHIVPKSIQVNEKCANCEKLSAIDDVAWACSKCNQEKGKIGLYAFFKKKFSQDKHYYDRLPPLLEKKYLKMIYCCHECAGTLDEKDFEGGRRVTALDVDSVLVFQG